MTVGELRQLLSEIRSVLLLNRDCLVESTTDAEGNFLDDDDRREVEDYEELIARLDQHLNELEA